LALSGIACGDSTDATSGEPLHANATAEQIRAAIDEVNAHAASVLARDDRSTAIASTR
jgi:hypothetical protein